MTNTPQTPDGYMEDALGRLVPINRIRPVDLERDKLVIQIAEQAKQLSDSLRRFREATHADVAALISLSAERYNVAIGGKKGNVTLHNFNGRYKISRSISETLAFDEGLKAAKALVDKCILKWSDGSRTELLTLINDAFQVDKGSQINTGRILTLRRVEIDDEDWQAAMAALSDSLKVVISRSYIRVYERNDAGGYAPINLDLPNANYVMPEEVPL